MVSRQLVPTIQCIAPKPTLRCAAFMKDGTVLHRTAAIRAVTGYKSSWFGERID